MNDLKGRLIRLGSHNPELREDLKPVLDYLTASSKSQDYSLLNTLLKDDENYYEFVTVSVPDNERGDGNLTVFQDSEVFDRIVKDYPSFLKGSNDEWYIFVDPDPKEDMSSFRREKPVNTALESHYYAGYDPQISEASRAIAIGEEIGIALRDGISSSRDLKKFVGDLENNNQAMWVIRT
jgi:hypothetical protein